MHAITMLLVGDGANVQAMPVTGQLVASHASWHQLFGPESKCEFYVSLYKSGGRVLVHIKKTQVVDGEEWSNFEVYEARVFGDWIVYEPASENKTFNSVPYFIDYWIQTIARGALGALGGEK